MRVVICNHLLLQSIVFRVFTSSSNKLPCSLGIFSNDLSLFSQIEMLFRERIFDSSISCSHFRNICSQTPVHFFLKCLLPRFFYFLNCFECFLCVLTQNIRSYRGW